MNDAEYQGKEFLQSLIREIGWTHEKYLINQTNFDKTLPAAIKQQAKQGVKKFGL